MTCSGNNLQTCGGPNTLTLFVSTTSDASSLTSTLTAAAATTLSLPGNWTAASTSCLAEGTSGRALAADSMTSPSMTVAMCVNYCDSKGYQYAGIEYCE